MFYSLKAPNDFVLVGHYFHYNNTVYRYEMLGFVVDDPVFINQITTAVQSGQLRQLDSRWSSHDDYRVRLLMAHNLHGLTTLVNDKEPVVRETASLFLPIVQCA